MKMGKMQVEMREKGLSSISLSYLKKSKPQQVTTERSTNTLYTCTFDYICKEVKKELRN